MLRSERNRVAMHTVEMGALENLLTPQSPTYNRRDKQMAIAGQNPAERCQITNGCTRVLELILGSGRRSARTG